MCSSDLIDPPPSHNRRANGQLHREPHKPTVTALPLPHRHARLFAIGGNGSNRLARTPLALHRYRDSVPHHYGTMNFGEWMAIELSPEQQFEIEKQARTLLSSPDAGVMAAALLKQACYQQQLLQQAVNEIARLECELMNY